MVGNSLLNSRLDQSKQLQILGINRAQHTQHGGGERQHKIQHKETKNIFGVVCRMGLIHSAFLVATVNREVLGGERCHVVPRD